MTTRKSSQGCGMVARFSILTFQRSAGRFYVIRLIWLGLVFGGLFFGLAGDGLAQEAEWIWSPEHDKDKVPSSTCHFRKVIQLQDPQEAKLTIAADDQFEVRINGRTVGNGSGYRKLLEYEIGPFLTRGRNVIAIKASNTQGTTAAMVARVIIKDRDGQWRSYSSDKSWKTNLRPFPFWDTAIYNDTRWEGAQSFGKLGATIPWDRDESVATEDVDRGERFNIGPEFMVQRVIDGEKTGSLIAMAFNEFGQIIAAKEGGPLVMFYDSDNDQIVDKVRPFCDQVKNCQGILALNGDVYVTGEGPQGTALYRLQELDRDGKPKTITPLVKFKGEMREHGPHAVTLGPDGFLYVVVGNLSALEKQADDSGPYRNFYEGDLVPRYEDPGGHAAGIKAPGGVILRLDSEGKSVQIVAGGLRNVYDIVFNRAGDLFAHDSDMETDEGTPWFRPTQLFHVTPGSDLGWRSGWARWPDYFIDCIPPILDTGRGSPTGAVVYNHFAFPTRYHDALFLADWSFGRILVTRVKPNGASYSASSEVFLEGHPLNITDLEIGPEGGLYFITGGRGTGGGLYRVIWKGKVPESVSNLGSGITSVIRQPQLQSAWSRQQIARLKSQIGDKWDAYIEGVARSASNPPEYRARALDVMQLFGPIPSFELLVVLSSDKSELVRGKAAELMGIHDDETTRVSLIRLLQDPDRTVRRKACESLLRAEQSVSIEQLLPVLDADDRFESTAARRLLERMDVAEWQDKILASDKQRVVIQGCLAMIVADPTQETARRVLQRMRTLMSEFVSDRNFIDLLRVMQVTLHRVELPADELADLRKSLSDEYPSGNVLLNRELVKLLVALQCDGVTDRFLALLKSDASDTEKLHVAMQMRYLENGWKAGQRLQLIDFCEKAIKPSVASNYPLYLKNVLRDFARTVSEEESRAILAQGSKWPHAALGALYKLPQQLDDAMRDDLRRLDKLLAGKQDETSKPLQVGIVAVLARSGDEDSMEYLREIWKRDPDRRATVAMGLAQQPDGENWDYLVRSLSLLDGVAALEVINRLSTVDQAPDEAICYREVILRGMEMKEQGADQAVALLEHWAENPVSEPDDSWETALKKWQGWFRETYPDQPEAKLPVSTVTNKYEFSELLEYLTSGDGSRNGTSSKGADVFTKAQCAKCHRHGDRGERMGPDLTGVAKRFTRKELLESIYYPSHVISDQFASQNVITTSGRQYVGIVAAGGNGERIVLQANGEKITLRANEIEEVSKSNQSAMPEGLLNTLTQEEIADLLSYLGSMPSTSVSKLPSTKR